MRPEDISSWKVSFGHGLNSNMESQHSWEQLKVLALLFQWTRELHLEMLTDCCKVTWWSAVIWDFCLFPPSMYYTPITDLYSLFLKVF